MRTNPVLYLYFKLLIFTQERLVSLMTAMILLYHFVDLFCHLLLLLTSPMVLFRESLIFTMQFLVLQLEFFQRWYDLLDMVIEIIQLFLCFEVSCLC